MNVLRILWDRLADRDRYNATMAAKEIVRRRLAARGPTPINARARDIEPGVISNARVHRALVDLASAIGVDATQLPLDERLLDFLTVSPDDLDKRHRDALLRIGISRLFDPFAYDVFAVIERLPGAAEALRASGASGGRRSDDEWIDEIEKMSVRRIIETFA